LLRVIAGHHRAARGPAAGGVVKLREAQPILREAVEVRGRNVAAITPEVGVAEVVGENEENVQPGGSGQEQRRGEQEREQEGR